MAYVPNSNSVVAFQGTVPWSVLGATTNVGSIITVNQGSIATVIIGGSVAVATGNSSVQVLNFPVNQSVSGTVGASVIGTVPVVQSGTVISSISGNVSASLVGSSPVRVEGSVAVAIISGSIVASFTPPANQSVSGTVNIGTGGPISVLGTMSVLGTVPVTQSTTPWVITGSVQASLTPAANQSISGTVQVDVRGSVATVIIGGSIAASFTPPANQSVSGTVQADIRGSVAVAIISGSVAVATGNSSVTLLTGTNMVGSIAAYQGAVPWAVAGSVAAFQAGTQITSLVSTVPSSVIVGASIFGQLPAGTAMLGSVTAYQGAIPWTTNVQSSVAVAIISGSVALAGVANQSVSGNVGAIQTGTWNVSVAGVIGGGGTVPIKDDTQFGDGVTTGIWAGALRILNNAGTYDRLRSSSVTGGLLGSFLEDNAHTSGDVGTFMLGVRNDAMSSVTSASGDYSQVSTGPVGEQLVANSPITKWVQGTASMLGGTPVTGSLVPVIAAQGASVFTYITGLQIANASANNAWITLLGGTNSVIGFTTAPANGGSNIVFPNALKTSPNAIFSASISAVASVYVSAQGFTAGV